MELTFLNEYISIVALVICLIIGYVIKNCTSNKDLHQFIPLISAIIGVVICAWEAGSFTPAILATGLVSGLAATGLYEALRNVLSVGHEYLDSKNDAEE